MISDTVVTIRDDTEEENTDIRRAVLGAMAYVSKVAGSLPKDTILIANLSGRGDKDVEQASRFLL